MGYKLVFFIFIVSNVTSCKDRDEPYVSHEKWATNNIYNTNRLKNNPIEVKESLFGELDDTGFNAMGQLNSFELYRFDKDGNMIYFKSQIEGAAFYEIEFSYSKDGPQVYTKAYDLVADKKPSRESNSIRSRIGPGTFKLNHFVNETYKYHSIISFLKGGQVIKEEKFNKDTLVWTRTMFCENNKRVKVEVFSAKEKQAEHIYYSAEGFLDSIVVSRNNKPTEKRIYRNNEFGDAVSYESVEDGETTDLRRMKYLYDEKGNWIKQICKKEKSPINFRIQGEAFPGYQIIKREIKY